MAGLAEPRRYPLSIRGTPSERGRNAERKQASSHVAVRSNRAPWPQAGTARRNADSPSGNTDESKLGGGATAASCARSENFRVTYYLNHLCEGQESGFSPVSSQNFWLASTKRLRPSGVEGMLAIRIAVGVLQKFSARLICFLNSSAPR